MTDEVQRLAVFESECVQKDDYILALRSEISELQKQIRQLEVSRSGGSQDIELTQKLLTLESDVSSKKTEILSLKNEVSFDFLVSIVIFYIVFFHMRKLHSEKYRM